MSSDFLKKYRWWILAPILLLVGLIVLLYSRAPAPSDKQARIIRADLLEAAYAVGTVKADRTFNLKTGVSSRVLERRVRLGDSVKQGQALISLEGFPLYRAPFDGVITALNYEKGELVFAQTAVLTLVDLNSLYLELSLDERTVGSIRQGQKARISFEGQRAQTKQGKVRSIYANEGSFLVIVDADFSNLSLLPGMTCDVAVEVGLHKRQLLVPLGAVQTAGHLTLLRPGPIDVPVETGATDDKYTVIEKGDVHEGELVQLRVSHSVNNGGSP